MKKLVLIMAILVLCAPSFGAILVYKQSVSAQGFEFNWDEEYSYLNVYAGEDACDVEVDTTTLTSAQEASAKITGYVVMDVNVSTLLINDVDPNNEANFAAAITTADAAAISDGVALIIADKKAKTYQVIYRTERINGAKTAWENDANFGNFEDADLHNAVVVNNKKGDPMKKKTLVVFNLTGALNSYLYTDLNEPNYREEKGEEWGEYSDQYDSWVQEFGLENMTGALKKVDVDGSKTKVLVPTSLKGNGWSWKEDATGIRRFNYDPNYDAATKDLRTGDTTKIETNLGGKATLKLDKKATQTANTATPTTKGTVAVLVADLKTDGYTEVLPPAVPEDPEFD